jgi:hypothetical protein
MPQVFSHHAALGVRLVLLALFLAVPGFIGLQAWRAASYESVGEPVAQPIPFSHKHHVGDDGIDCRYCHTTVETSAHAGLPSTHICLSCHSQLYTEAAVLQPLRESARSGKPIAWQRVNSLPDFVYFNHSVHIAKGVACIECHGHVDQMPITWRAEPLQMQWCIACHRNPAPHLRPHDEVFDMRASTLTSDEANSLARLLESEQRRTDCSTCHR